MESLDDLAALQNDVALLTFDSLGESWESLVDVYVEVSVTSTLVGVVLTSSEETERPLPALDLLRAWERLRSETADPERGAWLSATMRLKSSGTYSFDYNYMERPQWPTTVTQSGLLEGMPIGDDEILEDLRRHPRLVRFMPDWMRAMRTGKSPEIEIRDQAVWPAGYEALEGSAEWQAVRDALRRTLPQVTHATSSGDAADLAAEAVLNELPSFRDADTVAALHRRLPDMKNARAHEAMLADVSVVMEKIAAAQCWPG